MKLDQAIAAVRSIPAGGDGAELVSATRTRIRRSLERRARTRHRAVRGGLVTLVLLVSTMSWALSTGRIPLFVERPEEPAVPVIDIEPPPLPAPQRAVPQTTWMSPPEVEPAKPVERPVAKPPIDKPAPKPAAPKPAEILYRKAHDLHFHGGDRAAALAAWDAYLAAEPTGRFAIEARYNRGLLLARLARYAEARAALAPFASGELGYRQHEAQQIVERLDALNALNGGARSGD